VTVHFNPTSFPGSLTFLPPGVSEEGKKMRDPGNVVDFNLAIKNYIMFVKIFMAHSFTLMSNNG